MRWSLRWKSIAILVGGLAIFTILLGAIAAAELRRREVERARNLASSWSSAIADQCAAIAPGDALKAAMAGATRAGFAALPGMTVAVVDAAEQGEPRERSRTARRPEWLRVLGGSGPVAFIDGSRAPARAHHITPVVREGRVDGAVDVAVDVESAAPTWIRLAAAGSAAALGIGLVAAWRLSRLVGPLAALADGAERFASGLEFTLPVSGRCDEVGVLSDALRKSHEGRRLTTIEYQEKTDALRAVLRNMVEGVLAIGEDESVLLANEASGRMLGFAAGSAAGRPLVNIARHRPLLDLLRRCGTEAKPVRDEFEMAGESRRTLSMRAAPLAIGSLRGIMIVIHDVTDLRRLENVRREFVANVSHELKTPLAAIKAYAETLRLGALEDAEHRGAFVERIEEQAERLHALISDLLLLARVEAGREIFEFTDTPLRPIVAECLAMFATLAEHKRVTLETDTASPDIQVHVDAEGLGTILNNLVDNAVKYTPEGGVVRVAWTIRDGYAELEVLDTGIGIPSRDQPRIFERFYRAEKARSRETGGTGLGLAIVKHLVQAFGGDIHLSSEEGRGSAFRVRLPLARRDLTRRAGVGSLAER
ncbi:MAG: PAS domain S-box protein [Planctomycetes bacterium]|nr:PAS domain S-box protein [Planctomycetota bacterium]